CQQYNDLVFTF
nr:immunoglobulin light chain junction region [Macaca mulatta]MOX51433.1 immunoglobulin light chain junction region [Macaca mulatta]MOX51441.1 immunoglobulin light chain junction region [Macaca mulatta]MOX51446.1 immunoglobulin light chain junction region [Macaca mulatta]MOX51456.1 immunoglobulin light chain junction region [Macaca mulatta]